MKTRTRLKIAAVVVTLCLGLLLVAHMLVFHLNWLIALNAWGENDSFAFVGRVIDITGNPVPDAEVDAIITYANTRAMMDGRTAKRYGKTVQTDVQGKFTITASGINLAIVDVRKEGFRWIYDLDSGMMMDEPNANNTSYFFSSWKPDPANLPLYPLQPIGETQTTRPSRGGFDKRGDGGWRKNVPTEPRMSSLDHPDEVKRRRQYRNRQDE